VVLLALRLEELAPALTRDLAEDAVDNVVALAAGLRAASAAPVLVHNFAPPASVPLAETQDPHGRLGLVRGMNIELARRVSELDGAHLLDVDHVFAQLGLRATVDERGARYGDAPLSPAALRALAEAQVR